MMSVLAGLLGGFGTIGFIVALFLGSLILFFLPLWAMVDCAVSKRKPLEKGILVVLLFFFWSAAGVIYGLFFTDSKKLHRFTLISLVGTLLLLLLTFSSCLAGAGMAGKIATEKQRLEAARLKEAFHPTPMDIGDLEPFRGIQFLTREKQVQSATWVTFFSDGPSLKDALPLPLSVTHVVEGPSGLFGITDHDFGSIHPGSINTGSTNGEPTQGPGGFSKIPFPPDLQSKFSWLKGLAYDTTTDEVVIMASHVSTSFVAYSPQTGLWRNIPAQIKGAPLVALTYSPEEKIFYALEHRKGAQGLTTLYRINSLGAMGEALSLHPVIPVWRQIGIPTHKIHYQMRWSSGEIILIPPFWPDDGSTIGRVFLLAIHPDTGEVFAPQVPIVPDP